MGFFSVLGLGKSNTTEEVETAFIKDIRRELESDEKSIHKDEVHRNDLVMKINIISEIYQKLVVKDQESQSKFSSLSRLPKDAYSKDGFPLFLNRVDKLLFSAVKSEYLTKYRMEVLVSNENLSYDSMNTWIEALIKRYSDRTFFLQLYISQFYGSIDLTKKHLIPLDLRLLQYITETDVNFTFLKELIDVKIREHYAFFISIWHLQTWKKSVELISKDNEQFKDNVAKILSNANDVAGNMRL